MKFVFLFVERPPLAGENMPRRTRRKKKIKKTEVSKQREEQAAAEEFVQKEFTQWPTCFAPTSMTLERMPKLSDTDGSNQPYEISATKKFSNVSTLGLPWGLMKMLTPQLCNALTTECWRIIRYS